MQTSVFRALKLTVQHGIYLVLVKGSHHQSNQSVRITAIVATLRDCPVENERGR